jgi:hypothetical protein
VSFKLPAQGFYIREVNRYRHNLSAQFSDFLADLMKRARILFQQDQICATGSKHPRASPADSLAGSGDQCRSPFQIHRVSYPHLSLDRGGVVSLEPATEGFVI